METRLAFAGCLVAAAFSGWQLYLYRREHAREHRVDDGRTATALAAILIAALALASATALLDAKLSEGSNSKPDAGDAASHDPVPGGDRGGLSEADRNAFTGEPAGRFRVKRKRKEKRLCLIRYAEREFGSDDDLVGKWWTSCRAGRGLSTVEDVKEEMALPARFGPVRDARVTASVPVGTRIVYFEGAVAPQCEHEDDTLPCRGHRYGGGAWQYLFPRPRRLRRWVVEVECTREREDRPSHWKPCAG